MGLADFGLCLATFDDAHDYKAADLLGLGVASVVRIPTDEASRMRCVPGALAAAP